MIQHDHNTTYSKCKMRFVFLDLFCSYTDAILPHDLYKDI